MTPTERAQQQEIARLRDELALLRPLMTQSAEQTRQITKLTAEIGRLIDQLARANERTLELLAIVNRKKRGAPKAKAEATPPVAPALTPDHEAAFAERPQPPAEPPREEKVPKKRSRNGPNPVPAHLPLDETICTPEVCTCGCMDLEIIDEVIDEKLDVVKEHQRRRRIVAKVGRCRRCQRKVVATPPPAPCERSKVTCGWLAWMIVQKFHLLLPLDRIRRDLALRRVPVAISFLVSAVERAADLLAAVDGEHWKQLKAGPWMQSDGTGLKVIVPDLPGTHQGYLEVYRRDETVVFQYEASKDGETAEMKLRGFRGLLVVDAENRYNAVFAKSPCLEAGCNAHGFRKFEDAQSVQPVLAVEGARFLSAVFAREAEARKAGLSGDALLAWRQEKIRPIYADLQRWMAAVLPTLLPDDKLAGAIRYYTNHWTALTRFVDHPAIPPDNSASEREFQTVAKARLSWLFAGSTEGAHRAATRSGGPAWRDRYCAKSRRQSSSIPHLGLRAHRHPQGALRPLRRPAHPGGLAGRASQAGRAGGLKWAAKLGSRAGTC